MFIHFRGYGRTKAMSIYYRSYVRIKAMFIYYRSYPYEGAIPPPIVANARYWRYQGATSLSYEDVYRKSKYSRTGRRISTLYSSLVAGGYRCTDPTKNVPDADASYSVRHQPYDTSSAGVRLGGAVGANPYDTILINDDENNDGDVVVIEDNDVVAVDDDDNNNNNRTIVTARGGPASR
ncbi:hypothetical protein SPI_03938 [Niveomyces insectorum RCEF 264]|uniref:Uncharacterized protein n=1 Tax=Niveomyces insectorum RCEF 264 TaxID=1081102 RepID=A0A167WGV9_9HYPO|nr:hypothetical protein SPI_03938 [Niveomyces insectorum RCEF 264]